MDRNIITLIVIVVTLAISALFSLGKIPLNMALFYLFAVNGVLIGSIGMAFEITEESSRLRFVLFGMTMFVLIGFLCKTYLPVLYFADLAKN